MFFEAPLITTFSTTRVSQNDDMSTRIAPGLKRKRAASTSLPLKTLCFNHDSSPPALNLESIFNYLPAAPRSHRNSWNAASFKHFKQPKSTVSTSATRPRSTTTSAPSPSPLSSAHALAPKTPSTGIASLPTELLCLIFDSYSSGSSPLSGDCAPDPDSHPYGFFSVSRDCVRTPLPLTQVCQRWRSTAIAYKTLWSSVALALNGDREEDGEDAMLFGQWARDKLQLLELFLTRARGVPLRVALSTSEGTGHDIVSEALKWICRYAHQWKEVRMDLGNAVAVQALVSGLSSAVARNPHCTFGSLESLHLELEVDEDDEVHDEERLLSTRLAVKDVYELIFRRAPNLSDLVLDDLFFIWGEGGDYALCPAYQRQCPATQDGEDAVPWHQLKTLTINSSTISARKVLEICAKAQRLEELKIWRVGCDEASYVDVWDSGVDARAPLTVTLPQLRSLDLTLVAHPAQLLGALSLPKLQRVDVDVQELMTWTEYSQAPVESILAPLNRMLDPLPCPVDVCCSIKSACVLLPEEGNSSKSPACRVVDAAWMEEQGLRALARSRGCVEVYKYASSSRKDA